MAMWQPTFPLQERNQIMYGNILLKIHLKLFKYGFIRLFIWLPNLDQSAIALWDFDLPS